MKRQAFTLIEILVVIAIIALLTGAVIGVGNAMSNMARHGATIKTIETAQSIIDEYSVVTGIGGNLAFPDVGTFDVMDTEEFIRAFERDKRTARLLNGVNNKIVQRQAGDVVRYNTGNVTLTAPARFIVDSWDRPMWYRQIPRIPEKGQFVSAGPDGEFGTRDDVEPGLDKR